MSRWISASCFEQSHHSVSIYVIWQDVLIVVWLSSWSSTIVYSCSSPLLVYEMLLHSYAVLTTQTRLRMSFQSQLYLYILHVYVFFFFLSLLFYMFSQSTSCILFPLQGISLLSAGACYHCTYMASISHHHILVHLHVFL